MDEKEAEARPVMGTIFLVYKVCDVNSIPANLRNSKPWTIYHYSLDFTKFPLTKVSNLVYVIFTNMRMQKWRGRISSYNGKVLGYKLKNDDAKMLGRTMRVRMNESQ